MSIIKGAVHHHICSNRLWDVVAGAAHRNPILRCSAPCVPLFVLGYKYFAALPLLHFFIFNTEGVWAI